MASTDRANNAGIVASVRAPLYGAIRPTATSSDGYGSNAGLWRATPSANWPPKVATARGRFIESLRIGCTSHLPWRASSRRPAI